jgi:hypothetical protein
MGIRLCAPVLPYGTDGQTECFDAAECAEPGLKRIDLAIDATEAKLTVLACLAPAREMLARSLDI